MLQVPIFLNTVHKHFIHTVRQRGCEKMFSICHSVWGLGGEGGGGLTHVTITHNALNLTVRPSWHETLLYTAPTPASDIWWPILETCSNLFSCGPPNGTDIWWLMKHIQLPSWQYASYWNAFLLSLQQGATINTVVGALAMDSSPSLRANKDNYHWPRSNVPVEHAMWIVSPARPVSSGGICLRCKFDVFSTTSE